MPLSHAGFVVMSAVLVRYAFSPRLGPTLFSCSILVSVSGEVGKAMSLRAICGGVLARVAAGEEGRYLSDEKRWMIGAGGDLVLEHEAWEVRRDGV
jgi:hypothetical protein